MTSTLRNTLFATALGSLALSGCVAPSSDTSAPQTGSESKAEQTVSITGQAAYRERIALTPDYTFAVTLSDVSVADGTKPVLAVTSRTLSGEQVPLSFELDVNTAKTSKKGEYALRATLHDPLGNLEWTTDTVNPVSLDKDDQAVGTLMMVKASADAPNDAEITARLRANEWQVEDINRSGIIDNANVTMVFSPDGRVGGSSGCNSYNGGYAVESAKLSVTGLASSLRACAPALMDLERKFLNALDGAERIIFDQNGRVTLQSSNGQSITAISTK